MNLFETHPKALRLLLTNIEGGELCLPDFQRDFVWDPSAVEELIESIMRQYPAGSLLFLKHGGDGFMIREFAGAPKLSSNRSASYLVMDGQQRLTSLYQAFYGKGDHVFLLDLNKLENKDDIEDAVWHETRNRAQRHKLLDLATQAEKLYCPLSVIMTEGFDSWVDAIIELRKDTDEGKKALRAKLRQINKDWITPILDYQFPIVTLDQSTPMDAVCKMFETLNRRGVKLGPFELLMARAFASQVSLREMWDQAQADNKILNEFQIDPYYILQIISVLEGKDIKRTEVLNLTAEKISKHWNAAVDGLSGALQHLRKELGVLNTQLLPYVTMLVPMGAIWKRITDLKGPAVATAVGKVSRYFWASVFLQWHERGASSRAVSDYKELQKWIFEDGPEPKSVRTLYFNRRTLFETTHQQRALYRGVMALSVSKGTQDFHKGERLTYDYLANENVDDHHIFPQAYLKRLKTSESTINCVLNKTLIDRKTNIRISDNEPAIYAGEIIDELGQKKATSIFESHLIDLNALIENNIESLFERRADKVMRLLEEVIGRKISGSPLIDSVQDDFGEDQDEDVNDEIGEKERTDVSELNVIPIDILDDLPKWIADNFEKLVLELKKLEPELWWRRKKSSLSFFSPHKNFLTVRFSRNGMRLNVFTRGKQIQNIEPIVTASNGGALWGRIKVGKDTDFQSILTAIESSLVEIKDAVKKGESTAWWAMAKKNKAA